MNRTIHKLRPTDYWRIGENESWLEDMAAEGLHLKKMGFRTARFMKGEPKKTRYRIEVVSKGEKTEEQKQILSHKGWDYVTSYGDFNVFSSPLELNAPELYADPVEQSFKLKKLEKKLTFSAIFVAVAILLIIGIVSALWISDSTPALALIDGILIQQMILVMVELHVLYASLKSALYIRSLRKRLEVGQPIDHNAPWRNQHRLSFIAAVIFSVLAVFAIIIPWMQIARRETKTLPLENTDLPIIRLTEVEQNPQLVRKPSFMQKDIDWLNRYTYDWGLLAPVQYESNERGTVPGEMWKDGSGEYSPSIETRVYELVFPSMAEGVISDLIKRYGMEYKGGDFVQVKHSDFDILIVHDGDDFKEIFASKGKAVMHVSYFGYADINTIIKSINQRISLV